MELDEFYMSQAMKLAREAEEMDEVPVGAVIVRDGEIIAMAKNRRQTDKCATAHAEILAIEEACKKLGGWRLVGCTMYVTLEPCPMCAGAIVNARVERVVYGAPDHKAGAFGTMLDLTDYPLFKPQITKDVLKDDCSRLLTEFFKRKR